MDRRNIGRVALAVALLLLVSGVLMPLWRESSPCVDTTAPLRDAGASQHAPAASSGEAGLLQRANADAEPAGLATTADDGRNAPPGKRVRLKKLPAIDRRVHAALSTTSRQAAVEVLRKSVPGVEVQFDPVTGSPDHIVATGRFLTQATGGDGDAADPVRQFINDHAALFGHYATVLGNSRVTRDDVTAHSGMRTLVWQQQVDGIPVYNTILKANLTKDGALITLGSHFMQDAVAATGLTAGPRAALVAQPPVDVAKAVSLAAANLGDAVAPEQAVAASPPEGAERKQRFTAPKVSDTVAQLSWLPTGKDAVRLTWDVTLMSLRQNEMFRVLVDVQTGEVLMRTSLTNDATDATFRVYADAATKKPFDSPAPMLPGTPTPSGVQGVEVPRNLVTLQSVDPVASPNGWIDDGGQETVGNNVDAHTDTDADNVADLPRPNGGASRIFDFAADLTLAPDTCKDAATTHLFYMCNWMHDKLYGLGFTESAGNFQTDNFGRGGLGNDAVQADAQDGSGTNNANFSTPGDGSAGRMQMYVFTGPSPARDGDFDDVVVLHEYTHGLSNRLVGGGSGISATATGGMGEGWSDFYGLALLADPSSDPNAVYPGGSYATFQLVPGMTTNYYYGIRRYPYCTDMAKNPLTFRDIDPSQASPHAGIPLSPLFGASNSDPSEVHNVGEVWCVTLWECRSRLIAKYGATGNQKVLQLVTDAMKLCPANPNLLQSRDAIIQADLAGSGGADAGELWAAFAKRGMGAGATSPASSTTTGVVESYDLPDDLGVTPIGSFLTIGDAGGPFTPAAKAYTLANNGPAGLNWTATDDAAWLDLSAAAGVMASGATATVTATVNAAASGLADGLYSATITFTNTVSGATLLRTVTLRVGQVDYFTEIFDSSSPHDVGNQSFLFTPNATASGYAVLRQPVTAFFTDPAGGTSLPMSDDTSVQVTPAGGQQVRLYGVNYGSFYVGSNGYITFTSGDIEWVESAAAHFNLPRVSALMDDLLPATGQVTWRQTADRVAVTWQGVTEYGASDSNSFQIELFFDGRIRITNLAIAATDGLIGLSRGTDVPADFVKSDFSAYPEASPGDDVHHFTISNMASPRIKGAAFSVNITARDGNGLTVAGYNGAPGLSAAGDAGPVNVSPVSAGGFFSGVWTVNAIVNTFDTHVVLVVNDGAGHTGTSNAFDVGTGPLHHFAWSTVPDPGTAASSFGAAITAQDAGGNTVTAFSGTANLGGYITNGNSSSVVITEVNPNTPDEIEFMNVGSSAVNVSGWQVYLYDEDAGWPAPKTVFVIPAGTTCAAGQIFRLQEFGTAPGAFPQFFYGSNLNWTSDGASHVAVLLRDASGNMVDFFCAAAAAPSAITSPVAIPASQWSGATVGAPGNIAYGYSRVGGSDASTLADWTTVPPGMGTVNPGLITPFPPPTSPVTISPTISGSFSNGAWTGTVTVLQSASQMRLRADDGAGHIGDSNAFDVVAPMPPAVTTLAATKVSTTSATLNATINPNGGTTIAKFRSGPTTSYGADSPITLAPSDGTSNQGVSVKLTGLTPGTIYHFQATGTNTVGTTDGGDFTLTTITLPYQQWAVSVGLAEANLGPLLDPNGNGVPNLLEWAFGTSPLLPGRQSLSVSGAAINTRGSPVTLAVGQGSGGTNYLAAFCRRKDFVAAGLTYLVEFSGDLSAWAGSIDTPVAVADDGVIEVVTIPYPAQVNGQPARFFHVAVTGP